MGFCFLMLISWCYLLRNERMAFKKNKKKKTLSTRLLSPIERYYFANDFFFKTLSLPKCQMWLWLARARTMATIGTSAVKGWILLWLLACLYDLKSCIWLIFSLSLSFDEVAYIVIKYFYTWCFIWLHICCDSIWRTHTV